MPFRKGDPKPAGSGRKRSKLSIEYWPVDRLKPYERNPRKNDHAVDRMVASIREYGFTVPILARSSGEVIDGHLRLKAAAKIGSTELPVIVCDGWTEAQVKAFRLLANRSVAWAEWDTELLALEFGDLRKAGFDLSLTGFDLSNSKDQQAKVHIGNELREKWGTVEGQHWMVGRHTLVIGDSRTTPVIDVDGIVTDPPYDHGIEPIVAAALDHWGEVAVMLIPDRFTRSFAPDWRYCIGMVWMRRTVRRMPGYRIPLNQHTSVGIFAKGNAKTGWRKPSPQYSSIILCEKEYECSIHGQGKSAEIFERMLDGFPQWRRVGDPFCGSGATILAAENTGRTAIGCEESPVWAAVALERCSAVGLKCSLAL